MAIQELPPIEAEKVQKTGAVLVDVRTEGEFGAGHPTGALNVPFFLGAPGAFSPNPDFLAVMTAVTAKDANLLLSCASGGRSMRAAQFLDANGWKSLTSVRAGFSGAPGVQGWAACKLPVENGHPEGCSYAALRARAKLG